MPSENFCSGRSSISSGMPSGQTSKMDCSVTMRLVLFAAALLALVSAQAEEPHPGAAGFADRMVAEYGLDREHVDEVLADARYQQSIIDRIRHSADAAR